MILGKAFFTLPKVFIAWSGISACTLQPLCQPRVPLCQPLVLVLSVEAQDEAPSEARGSREGLLPLVKNSSPVSPLDWKR